MVTLGALWLPILLSAVFVFILSALVHMVLKYHASDYKKLANEDAVRTAIRSSNSEPGQYFIPYCASPKDANTPEMQQKFKEGPVGMITLKQPGPMTMGPNLAQWFVFTVIVSVLVAYAVCHMLAPGVPFRHVFRIVGSVAILAYAIGHVPAAIWMGKPWSVALKEVFDGVLYGLVTAATFAWLWPR